MCGLHAADYIFRIDIYRNSLDGDQFSGIKVELKLIGREKDGSYFTVELGIEFQNLSSQPPKGNEFWLEVLTNIFNFDNNVQSAPPVWVGVIILQQPQKYAKRDRNDKTSAWGFVTAVAGLQLNAWGFASWHERGRPDQLFSFLSYEGLE